MTDQETGSKYQNINIREYDKVLIYISHIYFFIITNGTIRNISKKRKY